MTTHSRPSDPAARGSSFRSFGRRLGRPLKGMRKNALEKLELFVIPSDFLTQDGTLDPVTLFPASLQELHMEIGFGSGEHLLARLAQNSDIGFIGAEPYINGMSALLSRLPQDPAPKNLRLHMDDALTILRSIKDNSLNILYILNPDPWPKARHAKRRIINPETLTLFARVLKPGGRLVLSTDVPDLAAWMIEHISAHPAFSCPYQAPQDCYAPPPDWPLVTRYMTKGVTQGRPAHYLTIPVKKT